MRLPDTTASCMPWQSIRVKRGAGMRCANGQHGPSTRAETLPFQAETKAFHARTAGHPWWARASSDSVSGLMRIALFLPHVGVFGGVRRFIELGNAWTASGHAVTLFHPGGE